MELKKCAFCGKSVVPELPHYEIDGISVCYHCGGCKTLFNLAALDVGFSVVMDEPLSVPHIVVENVDGDMVEKAAQSEDFRNITYGRTAMPDEKNPSYDYADFMYEAMSKKFGADGEGIPKECVKAGYMNLCDFFTDSMVDYLLSDGHGGRRGSHECEEK